MGAGEGFDWAETWRMSGIYCCKEKGEWGVRVILLPFLKIFKSSSFPATWNPASQARVQASWAAFVACHSPSHTCAPAKLYCTALPYLCAFPRTLSGNWNVNFWDWLLVKNLWLFKTLLQVSSHPEVLPFSQPIHLSSSVSLSPVTTSQQELVILCICAHALSPETVWWEDRGLLSAADMSHCALRRARGSTEGSNNWTQICVQIAPRVTLCTISLWPRKNGTWHGGPGNMKVSFRNRLLGFKSQLHYILSVWPWWASCLISLCLSFFFFPPVFLN